MAFGKRFSVAENIQGEWRQVRPWKRCFAFSLRIMGDHRGLSAQESLVRLILFKDKMLAGRRRMAGRQEGKTESIKVVRVSGDGGLNVGVTQWGGLRGWMRVSGHSGGQSDGKGPLERRRGGERPLQGEEPAACRLWRRVVRRKGEPLEPDMCPEPSLNPCLPTAPFQPQGVSAGAPEPHPPL